MLPKLFITDIDGVWTDGGMYKKIEPEGSIFYLNLDRHPSYLR